MTVQIDMEADEADLDGWTAVMSQYQGEGMIIYPETLPDLDNTADEFATFTVDIPCSDTWHIWVRGHDQGGNDSFFVTVDGEMDPAQIFELDCTQQGGGQQNPYRWRELNQRYIDANPCDYAEDPWTFDWTSNSMHDIVFMPRESQALSRITITNDDQYMP
jgi:hypothetical protein